MMNVEPTPEHRWLEQMIGEWTSETECWSAPDQPSSKHAGTEVVRAFSPLWVIADGDGEGCRSTAILGFDPTQQAFVGSFFASSMAYHWVYRGKLDDARRVLTLDADGPSWADSSITQYHDIHEIVSPDLRTLRSEYLDRSGKWVEFLQVRYHRKK
jgi:Protein of unknown function (DUF1579)